MKLAIIAPHFVQYHSPLYRALNESSAIESHVLFLDDLGLRSQFDREFAGDVSFVDEAEIDFDFDVLRNLGSGNGKGFFSCINPTVLTALLRGNYDCILIQGYAVFSYWLSLFAARASGAKVLFRGEATVKHDSDRASYGSKLRDVARRFFLSQADVVFFSCSGNKNFLIRSGVSEEKLFPLMCSVDNTHFRKEFERLSVDRECRRRKLGVRNNDVVLIFSGRLIERKGIKELFIALSQLEEKNYLICVVGDGPLRQELESFSSAHGVRAQFCGFIEHKNIGEFYSLGDVFVCPSRYDPSPKALNEAMNFQNAVVVSDAVGTSLDLVVPGITGRIFSSGDTTSLRVVLSELLRDPELVKKMGRAAAVHVERYSPSGNVKEILYAIGSIIQKQ